MFQHILCYSAIQVARNILRPDPWQKENNFALATSINATEIGLATTANFKTLICIYVSLYLWSATHQSSPQQKQLATSGICQLPSGATAFIYMRSSQIPLICCNDSIEWSQLQDFLKLAVKEVVLNDSRHSHGRGDKQENLAKGEAVFAIIL